MHDRSVTKGAVPFVSTVRPGCAWDATPGIVDSGKVSKRRARNKAARISRRKNR